MGLRLFSLTSLVVLGFAGVAHGQVLPPPRAVHEAYLAHSGNVMPVLPPAGRPLPTLPLTALPYPVPGYRPSAYQVWQNYGLTYQGWLRPRVIQTPQSGFFIYNGAPFPYVYSMPGRHWGSIAPAGAPAP